MINYSHHVAEVLVIPRLFNKFPCALKSGSVRELRNVMKTLEVVNLRLATEFSDAFLTAFLAFFA